MKLQLSEYSKMIKLLFGLINIFKLKIATKKFVRFEIIATPIVYRSKRYCVCLYLAFNRKYSVLHL